MYPKLEFPQTVQIPSFSIPNASDVIDSKKPITSKRMVAFLIFLKMNLINPDF
jgi:hypothetical protein